MSYEDRTLVCVQCNNEFVFSVGEQQFFAEKGLTAEPKRCKTCRDARKGQRRRRGQGNGIYRSPAFEDSAPRHQKIRGVRRGDKGGAGRGHYRSPGLNDRAPGKDEYRSPAFREYETIKPEDEYRSPAYRDQEKLDPVEEYRAPGFREYDDRDPKADYRAPGYQDIRQKYMDEKPMFAITCSACGKEAMVPVLPDELEEVFCQECYAEMRKREREERRRQEAEAAVPREDAVEGPSDDENLDSGTQPLSSDDGDALQADEDPQNQ